jgi:8-amino-7-oxononanoate synthase
VASTEVIDYLVSTARTFIFDTALAPAAAGAAREALQVLVSQPTLAAAVRANAQRLADMVGAAKPNAAIVAVPVASPQEAVALTEVLADRGVRVGCFRPPSVPDGVSRLRMTARADLSEADLAAIASVLPAQLTTLSG